MRHGHHHPVDEHVEEEGGHQHVADEVVERLLQAMRRKEPFADPGPHEDPDQRKHRPTDAVQGQAQPPVVAAQIEAPPQLERRNGQQSEHVPIGQSPLEGHRPRHPFAKGGRLEVVLPREGQPDQSPTQPVQQRKPPLTARRRRNLGIHARNSAAPGGSGNAHSSAGDPSPVETASTEGERRRQVARNQKVPPDRSEGTFKVVRTAGLEPAHLTALPPQGSASANFATCALFCLVARSGRRKQDFRR